MLFESRSKKRKAQKPTILQREIEAEWVALVAKHSKPLEKGTQGRKPSASLPKALLMRLENPPGREKVAISSKVTEGGNTLLKAKKTYTGSSVLGISQMAKSNAVPVFSREEAIDISKMRRG